MSLVPHHPEARFQEPGSLEKHYRDLYRRCYGTTTRAATVIPRARVEERERPAPGTRDILHLATDDSAERIIQAVAKNHGLTVDDIRGARRSDKIVNARKEAYAAVARKKPAWSSGQLALFFRREASTIRHVLRGMGVR